MAKEYSINVPLLAIKPADQIIDYLNGKAQLAIVNPFFQLPGVPQISFPSFMAVKQLAGTRPGYQIVSPQIVYKTQAGTFTSKIVFNDDDGSSNNLTTNVRFYGLKDKPLTLKDYYENFKVLQKVVASRGVVKDANSQLINECVINYQLTQAYEMALMLRMLGLAPEANDNDLSILNKINSALNSVDQNNPQENQQTKQRIQDYIKFNTAPAPGVEDTRYIKSYNQNMLKLFGRSKPAIQSIIDIFADDMSAKGQKIQLQLQQKQPVSNFDQMFETYHAILRTANYQNVGSACYMKEYQDI